MHEDDEPIPAAGWLWNKWTIFLVSSVFAVLLLVGSFYDLQISEAVGDGASYYGIIFASFGEVPADLALAGGGFLLILCFDRKKKVFAAIEWLVGLAAILFGAFLCANSMHREENGLVWSWLIAAPVALAIISAGVVAIYFLARGFDRKTIFRLALALLIATGAEMALINIIKIPWARPRYLFLQEYGLSYFRNWWEAGFPCQSSFPSAGDLLKSFPSGHAGGATLILFLPTLLAGKPRLKKLQPLWIGLAFAYIALLAFSRIVNCAHFLSDVAVGFYISYLAVAVSSYLIARHVAHPEKAKAVDPEIEGI